MVPSNCLEDAPSICETQQVLCGLENVTRIILLRTAYVDGHKLDVLKDSW